MLRQNTATACPRWLATMASKVSCIRSRICVHIRAQSEAQATRCFYALLGHPLDMVLPGFLPPQ